MAGGNTRVRKPKAQPQDTPTTSSSSSQPTKNPPPSSSLPLARYASVVGTQSLLLTFTALFLPRSTASLLGPDYLPPASSSLDRPEHPFVRPLTASPALTLAWLCAGVGVVVSWSAGYMRVWVSSDRDTSTNTGEARMGNAKLVAGRGEAILGALKAVTLSVPVFYALLVLFGAPLSSHVPQTSLFSALLALLVVLPPVYALGLPPMMDTTSRSQAKRLEFVRLFSEFSVRTHIDRAIVYPAVGTIVGGWLGAFVLPLDWDRPWQAWPLVPAYMAIFGHVAGSLLSLGQSMLLSLAELDKSA